MLNITDGESVAGTLRESAVPGQVSTYGDLMFEGPAPAGLDARAWRDTRARFMVQAGYTTLDEAQQHLKACEDTLAASSHHEEVVIWLDHRLSNQLILAKTLDWYSRQDLGDVKVSLICVGPNSGIENFVALGALTARQLAELADTRLPVTKEQYQTARVAWTAFTSPDPMEIQRFIGTDTSALSFVATALRRHLEQFPSADSGLSRTERQTLSVLGEEGSISGTRLFLAVQRQEEAVFMGDKQFYRLVADLHRARHPLVRISDPDEDSLGNVTITEAGRKVLEGRADHIALNGIDRWLGGVRLKGDRTAWRWHREFGRLVASQCA